MGALNYWQILNVAARDNGGKCDPDKKGLLTNLRSTLKKRIIEGQLHGGEQYTSKNWTGFHQRFFCDINSNFLEK